MKSSVSIALFFLLSGCFLSALLGAIEHSGKLLITAGACLAGVVCIIVFLTPVEWPSWHLGLRGDDRNASVNSTDSSTISTTVGSITPRLYITATTEALGVESR